ncbi:MAG TPA: GNAT family N-acetyltransferase [Egicoccus sp.]|nr:GNAT family N-acetyltransferase [Egicoccus sp.]HSK24455.1 GNAT family N-acetyltransferase [Egicoccus sp.]
MRLRPVGVTEFATLARPLLTGLGEAQHSLALGVLSQVEAGIREAAQLCIVEDGTGRSVGVGLQTPPSPWIIALHPAQRPGELAAVLADVAGGPPADLVGEATLTAAVAGDLARDTNATATCLMAMPIMACQRLRPPAAVPSGRVRPATPDDLGVVADLQLAFQRDALPHAIVDPAQLRVRLAHRLMSETHGIRLFERPDGRIASMAEFGSPTPNGARVYAVYTPPEERGRGYAAATVAAVTAEVLAAKRFAFLNTDAANPTSNAMYARLGYVVVGEQAHWRLR